MSRLFNTLLLAFGLLATTAHAADEFLGNMPKEKTKLQNTDDIYVGIGVFNDQLNANLEFVTEEWGNIMVRTGRFHNIGEGIATNMSWRRALTLDNKLGSGYYIGIFGGQVVGDYLGGEYYQRLGGGAEMGYHWVTEYTRAEATIGLGAAQGDEKNGVELPVAPTIFFNFNIALGY